MLLALSKLKNRYFVGTSLGDVLADTDNGKRFGFGYFSSHRKITTKRARALQLEYLEEGISSVQEGVCKSFYLGTPHL